MGHNLLKITKDTRTLTVVLAGKMKTRRDQSSLSRVGVLEGWGLVWVWEGWEFWMGGGWHRLFI